MLWLTVPLCSISTILPCCHVQNNMAAEEYEEAAYLIHPGRERGKETERDGGGGWKEKGEAGT